MKKQRDADHQYERGDDHPGREDEIHDDADGHDGNDPHQSVTPRETALHVLAIGRFVLGS